jgi:hypothetical protein
MDVFLIPTGGATYELYTEHADELPEEQTEPPAGFFARMKWRFSQMMAEAERDRRRGQAARVDGGWASRMTRRVMRWVVESMAEQRLLWNLRGADNACFFYPSDITESDAVAVLRRQLNKDFEKHRFWLAIDSLLAIGSVALVLVPGPNILGYYFVFRVVGHFFSVRGARRGLAVVKWDNRASEPLAALRQAGNLDPVARLAEVERIAAVLRLEHLATFFQRVYSPR